MPNISKSVVKSPQNSHAEISIVHRIPAHGVVTSRPDVLVQKIITQKQVHALQCRSNPGVYDGISRKFDASIIVIKLGDNDGVRGCPKRGVETHIQPNIEVHRPTIVPIIVNAVPSVPFGDCQNVVKIRTLINGIIIKMKLSELKVLTNRELQQVNVSRKLCGLNHSQ